MTVDSHLDTETCVSVLLSWTDTWVEWQISNCHYQAVLVSIIALFLFRVKGDHNNKRITQSLESVPISNYFVRVLSRPQDLTKVP